jgi:colanic acid biosynthesis glycosyl transferase WcaI
MHVLFVTHYFAPDSGAAANRLTRLAAYLAQRGHSVTVLTTLPHYPIGVVPRAYRRRWTVIEERDGVRVIHVWLWTTNRASIAYRLISQLSFMVTCSLRGLFVRRPDVLFVENQPIFTGLAGWFLSKARRRAYVLNISDYWPEYLVVAGVVTEASPTYRVFHALANLTQRDAGGLVAMLDDLLTRVEARIGKVRNSRVIYNAVDLDKFHPEHDAADFRARHCLGDATLVTFLGVLGPHIDINTMLAAARQFSTRADVRFLFVGAGAQKAALDSALAAPDLAHCLAIDWLDSAEIPEFWAASHVHFWALHHNELDRMRFQAKLYEALASGTPTVIGVDGLMSEIMGRTHTGITVAPGDADGLAQEIAHLLDDAQHHQRISRNARAYAEANFDLQAAVDAYEALLRSVAR